MKEESEELLSDQDFDEPAENKFYWEVTKYIRCREYFYRQYTVTFSLRLELLVKHRRTTRTRFLILQTP